MSTTPVNDMVMPVMKNIQPVNQSKFEMFCLPPQQPVALYQTAQPEVLLNNNICRALDTGLTTCDRQDVPFTAAMTNRICIVSVAQVKWV